MSAFYNRRSRRRRPVQIPDKHKINDRIRAKEVLVIDDDGTQIGVMDTREAVRKAEDVGLDLVEVSPNSDPPVCKIMDYGKFKYKEQKKLAEARKKRTEISTKEIRIRYRTDVGDLETKLGRAREFLEEGNKVKFSMRFRGREAMYLNLGEEKLNLVAERLSDISEIDEKSPVRGNYIYMILTPVKQR